MSQAAPVTAYVALGANLGDREGNIRAAVRKLDETPGVTVARVSPNYENPAVGGPAGSPPFVNAVAEVRTTLDPHELLRRLLGIEAELGRTRRDRWEPRPIDLDLVLYGDLVLHGDDLTLPHPRMHERPFVLKPLAAIAPGAVHPTLHATASDLLGRLPPTDDAYRILPSRLPATVIPVQGTFFDRLNLFDRICAGLAMVLGCVLLLIGAFGLFFGCNAHFTLPPVLGALPALAGWGIFKSVVVAFRASRPASAAQAHGFPVGPPG